MTRNPAAVILVLAVMVTVPILVWSQSRSPKSRFADYVDGSMELRQLIEPEAHALAAASPASRERAAKTLVTWLTRSWEGIHSGEIESAPTPFLNAPMKNRGWDLITDLPRWLDEPLPDEAAPIAGWYLHRDHSRLTATGLEMVRGLSGPKSDALLKDLIANPPVDLRLLKELVEVAADRSLDVPRERLVEFASGYRRTLALAARTLNDRLGYVPLPPFDPDAALSSSGVKALMDRVDSLIVDRIPPDAPYVQLRYRDVWPHVHESRSLLNGWMLEEKPDSFVLYDPYGTFVESSWSDTTRDRFGGLTWSRTIEYKPFLLEDEVKRLDSQEFWQRGGFPPGTSTISDGPWTMGIVAPSSEITRPQVFELHVVDWIYRYAPRDLAASAVLNMIQRYPNDKALLDAAEVGIGDVVGYRMLEAFVGERDYDHALELARLVTNRYPMIDLADEARELLEQLPRRRDDFKGLRLPTLDEWRDLQRRLSRGEQIVYLCDRLRLLNCDSGGTGRPQFANSLGLSGDARHVPWEGTHPVINPRNELEGEPDGEGEDLNLTQADIAVLAPYLDDDDFILSVGYPVDGFHLRFSPERWLIRVSTVAAEIINTVAPVEICKEPWYGSPPDEQEKTPAREVLAWVEANRDRAAGDIIRERLGKETRPFERNRLLTSLVLREGSGAVDDLLAFAADSTNALYFDSILYLSYQVGPEVMAPYARRLLDVPKKPWLRLKAARTLAEAGDKEGLRILHEEIEKKGVTPANLRFAVTLFKEGNPEDVALVDRLLPAAKDTLLTSDHWEGNLTMLARAGRREGFAWLLEALADTTATGGMRSHSSGMVRLHRNTVAASAFLDFAVPESLQVGDFFELSTEGRAQALRELETWAHRRLSESGAGDE